MKKQNFMSKSINFNDTSSIHFANTENLNEGCNAILKKLFDDKRSQEFRLPVDYEFYGLSNYPLIIKKPMDLSTVKKKLNQDKYSTLKEFSDDIQLIWDNCITFNQEGSVNKFYYLISV
jgi:hypothetical protein